jgi:mRNA turnover protein 4
MPKSKRAKVVHLTKTDKKGKELSLKLFANVQEAADNFEHIFVFAVENMRNSYLKEVRQEFADSRYVYRSLVPEMRMANECADSSSERPK